MFPPSKRASSLEIDNPSPVPPYFLLIVPSTCLKASKIKVCLSAGIPMPVSMISILINLLTFSSIL